MAWEDLGDHGLWKEVLGYLLRRARAWPLLGRLLIRAAAESNGEDESTFIGLLQVEASESGATKARAFGYGIR